MDAISLAAARPHATHARIAPLSPRRVLTLTFALFTLMAWVGAERASACASSAFSPLALSTFEGADGDQCDSDGVGPKRDWQTVADNVNLHTTIDAPSANDTTYGSNNAGIVGGSTSENVPDSWNFTWDKPARPDPGATLTRLHPPAKPGHRPLLPACSRRDTGAHPLKKARHAHPSLPLSPIARRYRLGD